MSEQVGTRIFAFELGAIGALLFSAALLRRYGVKLAVGSTPTSPAAVGTND